MYDHRQLFPGFPGGGSGFPGFPGEGQGSGGGFPGIPGFPGGGQGAPSSPPPTGGQGGQNQPPPGPPPNFQPQKTVMQGTQGGPSVFAVDPGAIRRCLFRYTYIWLRRDAFWFYPVFVGRRSIAGWRWIGFTWVYFGIDLDKIESFTCV
ncbi:transporter [Bacillus sp. CH30_1T]|uniref:transporter n=1 Tax=Bacillus sp. CH30_1T TaxID=2604836 RepID=UPI0011EBCC88|nr:transporter [Bacillus sp. CH30_1T]KAA0565066.1 transporter [Bacillus sp. CH30_1T]